MKEKIIKEMQYSRGLNDADGDDIIIISDLDEIPNPEKIKSFSKNM